MFVVADRFAYSRQSHQNRSPIRTPDGRMWLTLPLERGSRGRSIADATISRDEFDPGRLWRALRFNYEASPFFVYYADDIRALLYEGPRTLGAMTTASIRLVTRWLRLSTRVVMQSELPVRSSPDGHGQTPESLQDVLAQVGGGYITPRDALSHDGALVDVAVVLDFDPPVYHQAFEGFEPNLSVIDVLFNHGPDACAIIRGASAVSAPVKAQ
jgi:hypothetical protein